MLLGLTLSILLILTLLSVILGQDFISNAFNQAVDGSTIVNGSTSTFSISGQTVLFEIDAITGAIAMIIIISTIGAVAGIQVLGSGLSSESVRMILIAVSYTGIWGVLSVLSFPLIISIVNFGQIIYIGLTILFVIGVIQKIGGN